ncbi:exodeoxyribonuclease VII large subunit [Clostridium tyrobutyricum]|uniref:Exodeoxyribonuclease 7 large subunit n=1 Tax=Clostridium tyrobutyricum DIVETGP TaxID=1408889 RepID=W6N193_CLOTY|nr:exodeoxyribonuclease VII large subunit [Clostridium tyrobutyricum]AND85204.1 exodeoxyribonuclease 7 large subunit [Clostridium tyrobutyricum]ANP70891.1 exodeoxyribonuclease VII large subunit [Clostridium tyrobutyricum]MBV4415207.1 exodeoxyribonuclease VII large subunit [Clostridium tyrobutyricum]MBV4432877.1 exodeoxyribonuclease VII large subunit [Clostridium tyrobutyricum]MBV4438953.1 exodeoxyribonuclease VII large subunit [Clostridium tyrobutyricum]
MHIKVLTVSDINNYIKRNFDNDFILNNASVKGEISNIKFHSSGHIYFSLKDESSKINCIMFRSSAKSLKFVPENGMKIILQGRISVYEKEGVYQFYCDEMKLDGLGELYIAFEKLKTKLEAKGLFDKNHKKDIPKYARKIGIVTSTTGAAVRDIINVTKRRNKCIDLVIYPSLVQGLDAAEDIINGINVLNARDDIEVIILARGGGSIEDLWCFNDERVADAVYNSKKPIITGVGHEIDYTIVDFVSDRRAPTPSAAAEIAVFDLNNLLEKIVNYKNFLNKHILNILEEKRLRLTTSRKRLDSNSPLVYVVNQYANIEKLRNIMNIKMKSVILSNMEKLNRLKGLLDIDNPLNILSKGYSIIQAEDGKVVNCIKELDKQSKVNIIMKDGKAGFDISRLEKNN